MRGFSSVALYGTHTVRGSKRTVLPRASSLNCLPRHFRRAREKDVSGGSGKTMRRDSGNANCKKHEQPVARLVRTGEASCSTPVGAKKAKSALECDTLMCDV